MNWVGNKRIKLEKSYQRSQLKQNRSLCKIWGKGLKVNQFHHFVKFQAKTKEGVREVFETATRAALQVKKKKKKPCVLF